MNNKLNKVSFGTVIAIIISIFSLNAFGQLSGNVNSSFDPFGNSSGNSSPANTSGNSSTTNSINAVQPAHRQKVIRGLVQKIAEYDRLAADWERYREQMRADYFRCGQTNDPVSCRNLAKKLHYIAWQKVQIANQYKQYYMNWLWHYENGGQ